VILFGLAVLITLVAGAYQLLALVAAILHLRRPEPPAPAHSPPLSILKPIRGLDPHFLECLRSHAEQDYPEFEMLFGVSDPDDAAIPVIEQFQREFPHLPVRLIHCSNVTAPNGKVGVLEQLTAHAAHEILLVSDSDIATPPGYLRRVVAGLLDPSVGLVTCLYRASADAAPGRWEALGIDTDFAPSVLVARKVAVSEFALGSTLCFRKSDLERAGGFRAIANYIADDYQLGKRISSLGVRIELSQAVVETRLSGDTWSGVWKHQLRWARTVRVSRGGGYAGLPVTNASLWALLLLGMGYPLPAAALLLLRLAVAVTVGWFTLKSPLVFTHGWLIPLRDLWGLAIWTGGMFGSRVTWRDGVLELTRDGRIGKLL
jgi:ceramide glucosyltransferase